MVNVASYNVRGLGALTKRSKIFNFIKQKFFDIAFLQETHSTKRCEKFWKSQLGCHILYAHNTSSAGGCAIIVKRHIKFKIFSTCKHPEGRYLLVDCEISDKRLLLANIYAPNTDDPAFFAQLFNDVDRLDQGYVIIGGDFNTVLNEIDKKGGSNPEFAHPQMYGNHKGIFRM